jgi:hypothetical protein
MKVDDLPFFLLNICIANKADPVILPICQCAFTVSFSSVIDNDFSLLEAYPNNCWEANSKNTMNLVLNDGCDSATLFFQNKGSLKRLMVTLGFCDKAIWSYVHFLKTRENKKTAKDICNSEYDKWKRSPLKGRSRTSILSASGTYGEFLLLREVSVHSSLSKIHGQYKSEIVVKEL